VPAFLAAHADGAPNIPGAAELCAELALGDADAALTRLPVVARALDAAGLSADALALLDHGFAHFPKDQSHQSALCLVRATLRRKHGALRAAEADLDAAELALAHSADPLKARYLIETERVGLLLDLGHQELAGAEALRAEASAARILARLVDDQDPDWIRYLSEPQRTGFAVDLARGRPDLALARMDGLLQNAQLARTFAQGPSGFAWLHLARATALLELAREAEQVDADPALAAERRQAAMAALKHAFAAPLSLSREEELEGWLLRLDAAHAAMDRELEQRALGWLAERLARQPKAFDAGAVERFAAQVVRAELAAPASPALELARAELAAARARVMTEWLAADRPEGAAGFLQRESHRFALDQWCRLLLAEDPSAGGLAALEALARAEAAMPLTQRVLGVLADASTDVQRYAAALPADAGALFLLPAPEGSHVFALDRHGVEHALAAPSRRLEALGRAWRRDLDAALAADGRERATWTQKAERSGARLAAELLPPAIAARLGAWKRCAIYGSELLPLPSLDALPLGGKPLGLSHATAYPGSPALALLLQERWPAAEPELASTLVAFPERSDAYGLSLGAERARLEALVAPGGRLRAGAEARLAELDLRASTLLAFVAAGLEADPRRRLSAIALAGPDEREALLEASELAAWRERGGLPPFVLLFFIKPEGGEGAAPGVASAGALRLAESALAGGARGVVVATRPLERALALGLCEALHQELRSGLPADEALRQARLALAGDAPADPALLVDVRLLGVGHGPLVEAAASAARR
jgi:hypothetical protein